ncbi:sensor domain-containing diguanylate cyclase [Vibrio sp. Of14-4]|uniref:sensor domain-containing diguanylate cyclase n=1 Tax=Vibrio sp. Of14-4 TaxID=2724878 RepID=UPI001EF1D96E|nr:sensor domain-containing diguanylate cyclase [Vibrio sp. Of14-4]MCG7489168.1 sensor domain-containing diguanylate cyclase [Vibrio sp. Of14-4]
MNEHWMSKDTQAIEKSKFNRFLGLYGYSLATLGLVILIINVFTYSLYRVQKDSNFELEISFAKDQNANLINLLRKDIRIIGSSVHFFYATNPAQWHNFPLFVQNALRDDIGSLASLQWMPRNTSSSNAKSPPSANEFRVTQIFPETSANLKIIGYRPSDQRFAHALSVITSTREAFISDKLQLLQQGSTTPKNKKSALVYYPVFNPSEPSQLSGVVVGAIDLDRYFKTLASLLPAKRFEFQIVDKGYNSDDAPIVYESERWNVSEGSVYIDSVNIANRNWDIRTRVKEELGYNQKMALITTFTLGNLAALLVSYLAFKQTRDRQRLKTLIANKTRKLSYLAYHDSLTGVENRRAFNETIKRRVLNDDVFTLVGFDVDRFKGINDNFGHTAGDKALQHIVSVIAPFLHESDGFYRLGGDEFFIIIERFKPAEVTSLLEAIILTMGNSPLEFEGKEISISLSLGAITRTEEKEEALLSKVDEQIYISKSDGRNQYSYVPVDIHIQ